MWFVPNNKISAFFNWQQTQPKKQKYEWRNKRNELSSPAISFAYYHTLHHIWCGLVNVVLRFWYFSSNFFSIHRFSISNVSKMGEIQFFFLLFFFTSSSCQKETKIFSVLYSKTVFFSRLFVASKLRKQINKLIEFIDTIDPLILFCLLLYKRHSIFGVSYSKKNIEKWLNWIEFWTISLSFRAILTWNAQQTRFGFIIVIR